MVETGSSKKLKRSEVVAADTIQHLCNIFAIEGASDRYCGTMILLKKWFTMFFREKV